MSKKNLVIVESPAKIKKLQSFLGSDYIVIASYGHFRDLDPKKLSVNLEERFEPEYIISDSKKNVVREFKTQMKKCQTVYLASDYDREGEAIAWHIKEVLKLKPESSKRIVFTEITKSAILNAVKSPTQIDTNMFYAQQARRVLDRIIGYLISPILWKQIQSSYQERKSLSAGRVQSVIVKLVIEREEEIKKFESSNYFKISGNFNYKKSNLYAELNKEKDFTSLEKTNKFLELCKEAEFYIDDIKTRKTKRQPPMPFITSSLQQEASNKLGMSPKDTMSIAQKLYEKGYITYMRTDSLVLSEEAHQNIKDKVLQEFGEEYYLKNKKTVGGGNKEKEKGKAKKSKAKAKTKENEEKKTQDAHEACRPTKFNKNSLTEDESISYRENRLYKLIWNRTMMSQMKPVECDITSIKIKIKKDGKVNTYHFISKKEVITFLGYLKVTEFQKSGAEEVENEEDNDDEPLQIEIKKGELVKYQNITAIEKMTRPPNAHFNEASLIKKLDELGIGRPSTYATMISNVQDRNYVEKKTVVGEEKKMKKLVLQKNKVKETEEKVKVGGEKDKLFPTNLGEIVNRFLLEHFSEILDYQYTAHVENQLDSVAQGILEWQDVIQETYEKIKPKLEEMNVSLTKEKDKYRRILGEEPESGHELVTYIGKFGPLVQMKDLEQDKVRFAPLGDLKMEEVTLEQALKLFKYPFSLGKYKKKDIMLSKGKYGIYLKYNKKNYSIGELEEAELTLEVAQKIIVSSSQEQPETKIKYLDGEIAVKTGKFGPYFIYQGKNYSIYKTYDSSNLSEEDITKIIGYKNKSKGKGNGKSKTNSKSKTDKPEKPTKPKMKKKIVKKKKSESNV